MAREQTSKAKILISWDDGPVTSFRSSYTTLAIKDQESNRAQTIDITCHQIIDMEQRQGGE